MDTETVLSYYQERVTRHINYLTKVNEERGVRNNLDKMSPERIERAAVAAATMDVSEEYGVTMEDVIKAVIANASK